MITVVVFIFIAVVVVFVAIVFAVGVFVVVVGVFVVVILMVDGDWGSVKGVTEGIIGKGKKWGVAETNYGTMKLEKVRSNKAAE